MYYFMYDDHDQKNQAIESHNDHDRHICDNCGGIFITYKGVYNFKIMGKLYDCYISGSSFVISEKFLNVLKENGFTGYEVSETAPRCGTVTTVGDPIKEKYYLLKVTGRCGMIRQLNGEHFPYCRKCHRKIASTGLVTTGVTFDKDEYDGSDIFAFDNLSNIPIVSEKIKDVLIENDLTNLKFVPINEWVWEDKIVQRSVQRRISKGSVYPELIEAWLKYGVITKEELAEYGIRP